VNITRLLTIPVAALVLALTVSAVAAKPAHTSKLKPGELQARLEAAVDFAPPSDLTMIVRQPNGAKFGARLTAAQLGGLLEVKGYTVMKGADGWWRYARGRDAHGKLVASQLIVGKNSPAGLKKGAGRVRESKVTPSAAFSEQLQRAASRMASTMKGVNGAKGAAAGPTVFKFPVLLFSTWWDSDKGQSTPQFQAGHDVDFYKRILNGFGGNPKGSLTEYYFENSYGQFLVQVDVYGPYTSARSVQDRCYYGGTSVPPTYTDDLDPFDNVFGIGGLGAAGMAIEATPQADPLVNFAQYDNNGDGYIDFMGIIHSGADMAVTGDPCNTWSHALPLSALVDVVEGLATGDTAALRGGLMTNDGVMVDRVFTMPEFPEAGDTLNIGVASHEMAHALGEPDYYAVNGSSSGDGDWDIMSGGSYMGNPSGSNPVWFNPATRAWQGWLKPTIVHGDLSNYKLQPREKPLPGYTSAAANPNVLLVPTKWMNVGQTDELGRTWTERDMTGLVMDPGKGYVVEGYYLEYASRTAGPYPNLGAMKRSPSFDRSNHGSGLLVYHFDYWARSNVIYGSNNAQNDPDRMQMDVEEFDYNDNTQDIALNLHRGEASDLFVTTATGMTSGTREVSPVGTPSTGTPQTDIPISGTVIPTQTTDSEWTVQANPATRRMIVQIAGDGQPTGKSGDCTLQLFHEENGELVAKSTVADSGSQGQQETIIISNPEPGRWVARVGDFALCTHYSGLVNFTGTPFDTRGSADTWSQWTEQPTGWAFTNIRAGAANGLDFGAESTGPNELTLDVLNLNGKTDVSPGYAFPARNGNGGRGTVSSGQSNAFSVPVFSNGSNAPGSVTVVVRRDTPTGSIVSQGTIALDKGYQRKEYAFSYNPAAEGPYRLFVTVDPSNKIAEGSESNNTQQVDGWAGPPKAKVLVVDDEGYTDGEDAYTGSLAALGVPYAVATRHVSAATMKQYSAVIWVGSIDRGPGQLDSDDRAQIGSYLDGGGKLWLASNRAAGALEVEGADEFLHGYFGADALETLTFDKPYTVRGTGDALGGNTYELSPYPVRPFSDVVNVASNGVFGSAGQVFQLAQANRPLRYGDGFGTRVDGSRNGFKSVLTSFSLSQAATADSAVRITRSVLQFFAVAMGQYKPSTQRAILFHTTVRFQVSGRPTPITAIALGKATAVTLFYRQHGDAAYTSLPMQRGAEPGTYKATIPGSDVTPDGVDYYINVDGKTFDPPQAPTAVTHAIAVGRPEVG
jgi:M6 family metalloprotease-like protein